MKFLDFKILHIYTKSSEHPSGFLTPEGKFYKCNWGKHEKFAGEYIAENNLLDEQRKFEDDFFSALSKDFLISEKRFICFNNPCDNEELFICFNKHKKMSKQQEKFISDYLIKINDTAKLKEFCEVLNV